MPSSLIQPIVFQPLFMERVWGGRQLETVFGKKLPPGKSIGESWEIVDRAEAQSVVSHGPWAGCTLHELWSNHRREIFGATMPDLPRFPILAKLLDAREKLSLQVHPPEKVAALLGGESKSELWYFAAADQGAEIFAGLRAGVEREQFATAMGEGETAELVHRVAVTTGDSFFVPSGRLHGIGGGNLIVEIQQNSDTTYRVFDWNRKDLNGKPRDLHREESMQAIDFQDFEPGLVRAKGERLLDSPHFRVDRWDLTEPRRASAESTFALFCCVEGAVECGGLEMSPGEFFLVPACAAQSELQPVGEKARLLRVTM